jgi:plastocyanin
LHLNERAVGIPLAEDEAGRPSDRADLGGAGGRNVSLEKHGRSLRVLAVAAGLAAAVACSGGGYGSSPNPVPTPVTGGGGSGSADVVVTINGMLGAGSYTPNPVTVKAGQSVAWRNADAIPHNPTGTGFNTGAIGGGATSAPITFSTAGTIDYHCGIHPTMVGTISVTQ